jgi:hypothetical protein
MAGKIKGGVDYTFSSISYPHKTPLLHKEHAFKSMQPYIT